MSLSGIENLRSSFQHVDGCSHAFFSKLTEINGLTSNAMILKSVNILRKFYFIFEIYIKF